MTFAFLIKVGWTLAAAVEMNGFRMSW